MEFEFRIYYVTEGRLTELAYGNGDLARKDFNRLVERGITAVCIKGNSARIGQCGLNGFQNKLVASESV